MADIDAPLEEAIRDVLLTSPRGTFAFEDITDMAWIEVGRLRLVGPIDFAADIERANSEVLPRILSADDDHGVATIISQITSQSETQRL